MEFKGLKYLLFDIEGTTSDIKFVKDVMFPYSEKELPNFLNKNQNNAEVQSLMKDTSLDELLGFIRDDVKHPTLKKLQGMIWQNAFENGDFKAPLYSDVLPAWKKWKQQGFTLGISSSGSVTSQKMFFGHTTEGDLLDHLENHFDLDIGNKKDPQSYQRISDILGLSGQEILFFSDVPEELEAAQKSGLQVAHIVRPGTADSDFPRFSSFTELELKR